ncbi:MAG: T9SS type A sorting domain-containing protein [Bacteroidia bacterium]|nr:T9SS type A sorting domain-containing protein [Bacteroidia bacterium]
MKKVIVIVILILGSLVSLFSQTVKGEILSDTNNITIVRLWGTVEERGFAHGYLLGDRMLEMHEGFIIPFFGPDYPAALAMIEQGISFSIDSVYIKHAKAMMNGAGAAGCDTAGYSYLDILVGNCWHDIADWNFNKSNSGFQCSTFMNWNDATVGTDLDGYSVISRHYDGYFGPLSQFIYDNASIIIHIPSEDDQQPWLSIGYVGDMGPTNGINFNGLSMFSNGLEDQVWDPDTTAGYEPIKFTFRNALESSDYNQDGECNMLDIRDAISSNPQGYSYGWNFSALGPSTAIYDSLIAMVAEVTPEAPYITFRTNSYPDTLPGDNLFAANSQIKRNDYRHYCWRYAGIASNIGNGTNIGSQENWDLMKDYANLGYLNLMFMQYIPEWDQLKLCVYNDSAAYLNDPVTYDVSEFFQLPSIFIAEPEMNSLHLEILPNPVSSEAVIRYSIDRSTRVMLDIYNSYGQQIACLIKANQAHGKYEVIWQSAAVRPGIYFCTLKAGNQLAVVKIIKL